MGEPIAPGSTLCGSVTFRPIERRGGGQAALGLWRSPLNREVHRALESGCLSAKPGSTPCDFEAVNKTSQSVSSFANEDKNRLYPTKGF